MAHDCGHEQNRNRFSKCYRKSFPVQAWICLNARVLTCVLSFDILLKNLGLFRRFFSWKNVQGNEECAFNYRPVVCIVSVFIYLAFVALKREQRARL